MNDEQKDTEEDKTTADGKEVAFEMPAKISAYRRRQKKNTLPSAKEIALSPFCFMGKLCAPSLLRGNLLTVRMTESKGRSYIKWQSDFFHLANFHR